MTGLKTWLYDEENALTSINIATIVMRCNQEPEINRNKIANNIELVMHEHPETELIMFGEMLLSWYRPSINTDSNHSISEPIPGPTTELLSHMSKKFGVYLCCGVSEKYDGKFHNSQVLLNPNGELQAVHRKKNLKTAEREAGYVAGLKHITITDIKGVRTGMIICADAANPRTMQELIQSRLELILFSLADDRDENWFMAKANARLYDAWIVSANRFGQEDNYWNGHAIISDPLGNLRCTSIDKEGYLFHTLYFAKEKTYLKKMARNAYVKAPLLLHVLKNWRNLGSYYK